MRAFLEFESEGQRKLRKTRNQSSQPATISMAFSINSSIFSCFRIRFAEADNLDVKAILNWCIQKPCSVF